MATLLGGLAEVDGLCLNGEYFADEIILSCDVGSEVAEGVTIEMSLVVLPLIIDLVEGVVFEIVVYDVGESSH